MLHSVGNEELYSFVATDVRANTFSCLKNVCACVTRNSIRITWCTENKRKDIYETCDGACLVSVDADACVLLVVQDGSLQRLEIDGDVQSWTVFKIHSVLRHNGTVHMTRMDDKHVSILRSRESCAYIFCMHTGELVRVIDAWPLPYTLDCVWRRTYPASTNTYFLVSESLTGICTIQYFMVALSSTYRGQFITTCMR